MAKLELPALRGFKFSSLASNIMFMNSQILDGDAPNLTDLLVESIAGVFVETDQFFRFRINPQTLSVRKAKIVSSTYTKLGYMYSRHGNDMTKLSYRGTTGWFHPPGIPPGVLLAADFVSSDGPIIEDVGRYLDEVARLVLSGQIDLTQSPVWRKFRRFEAFWDRIEDEMALYYDQRLFRGELISFNYAEDANDPLQIIYDFEFHAHTDSRTGSDRAGKALVHLGIR